jgi:hypothetical protein
MKQLAAAAGATDAGVGVGTVEANAARAFENIGQRLAPTVMLSGIYERGAALTENERKTLVESELIQEEFMGMPSEKRKRLGQQNIAAFQGQAGTTQSSFRTQGITGLV